MAYVAPSNRRTRRALLAGASVSAIAVGTAAPAMAGSPPALSQAWFAARVDASTHAAASGTQAATLSQVNAAQQNLAAVAARVQAMEAAQTAAAQAAVAASGASGVPNGLVIGGLQPQAGAAVGSANWVGAGLPTQTQTSAGRDEVTVVQTAPEATLTWQTFNVGAKTDLTFNQSAGGTSASNWVVLNRVEDPTASPTQILGTISAPGKVFIINANGIVFGAGSQVNLGSLIASTADITAAQFQNGIYGTQNGATFDPTFTGAAAASAVVVQDGAQIDTAAPTTSTSAGGYVMLFGGSVENDGVIETPGGQTVLGAGQDFILRAGYSTTGNETATVQGSQVAVNKGGAVTNNGLIISTLGDITLVGSQLTQAGDIVSTTDVNQRGTVHFLTDTSVGAANVTLAAGSVTVVNPDNSTTTALDSQRESLISQSIADNAARLTPASSSNPQLNDVGQLPDYLDESRIEITTGGSVDFEDGSIAMSQGGQIAVQAAGRVWTGDGAMLDVSGSTGAVLPMSSNLLTVNIQGNELRDAPVNRDTGLISSNNVNIDIADLVQVAASSADPSVRDYTAGGLLEVSGYLSNIGHTIDEWAAVGGTITLDGNEVITLPGATLNVSGGSVTVQGGYLPQSYLIGPGGQLYNVNTAPANLLYSGVYNGLTVAYQRFGGGAVYTSTIGAPAQVYQSGYTYGRDAGTVEVIAPTAILEGQIEAGVTNGTQQTVNRAAGVSDPYLYSQSTIAEAGTLDLPGYTPSSVLLNPTVVITDDYTPIADQISATGTLPSGAFNAVTLNGTQLGAEQLGGLVVGTSSTVTVTGPLAMAAGGTVTLAGADVAVNGNITALGGNVTLTNLVSNPFVSGPGAPQAPKDIRTGGVQVASGSMIDLSGEWTNAALDASNVAGEALMNGGTLTIESVRGIQLGQGSAIDVSAGGAIEKGNKEVGGKGGSVFLTGDDPLYPSERGHVLDTTTIASTFSAYGVNGGGTLSITVPNVLVATTSTDGTGDNTVLIDPSMFQTGFSDYVINGYAGLTVAPQTQITVAEPVYTFYGTGSLPFGLPTGTDPAEVFALILPPTYQADAANGRLTQRKGASVAFLSNKVPGAANDGGGAIDIGDGSSITVDPGQSVQIQAFGQITDNGTITAHGGTVSLVNESAAYTANKPGTTTPAINSNATLGLSVFVGPAALIDVSGIATTALDALGRPFGTVTAGGTIVIGGSGAISSGYASASDAAVIIAPGATLDASGASATIDLLAGTAPDGLTPGSGVATNEILDATNGGAIILSSFTGIFADGALMADAGGAGAAGGLLAIELEAPVFGGNVPIPGSLDKPHILTIDQNETATLPAGFAAGDLLPDSLYGTAEVSQQQIQDGGFGSALLFARDSLLFNGSVTLTLPVALTLSQGAIADTSNAANVTVSAPYVSFVGESTPAGDTAALNGQAWTPSNLYTAATFTADADLIDVGATVRFGIDETYKVTNAGGTSHNAVLDLGGFKNVTLDSTGDIRFGTGSLTTPGDVTLQGAQLYPTTGAVASIFAGYDQYASLQNIFLPDGTITILGNGTDPSLPYSIGGTLNFYAGSVIQDGIVRAPEGQISLGGVGVTPAGVPSTFQSDKFYTYSVTAGAGSITSVSLDGLTVPYGGTVDGVSYTYDGVAVGGFDPAVTIAGQEQTIDQGATLDMSGGGTLAGAGFVTGRGGSVNVLTSPFLQFSPSAGTVTAASLSQEPVYALVPGYDSGYAPTSPLEQSGSAGSVPGIGTQITIPAGVPGIAAGTYTLMPSYYALLPGAARVQVNLGAYDSTPGVTALGAGSYEFNANTSVANTSVRNALPVEVVLTTNAGVNADSEFNQETYSQFEIAQAAQFGTPRPLLPEDGKTLNLVFPAQAAATTALQFSGTADFAGETGYYGGQATVGGVTGSTLGLEITANGVAPDAGFTGIEASALDAIGAPSLVVGGTLAASPSLPTQLDFTGTTNEVVIEDGAVLQGPAIFLVAAASGSSHSTQAGGIVLETGSEVTTLGSAAPPHDSSAGYYYDSNGSTVVALSNGVLTFLPSTSASDFSGPITVAAGAKLLTDGTLNFATAGNLSIDVNADYGARYLSLDLPNINVVSDADLAATENGTIVLPSGLVLTQETLARLLQGDTSSGAPALQSLILSAADSLNFVGSVSLDTTSLQDLVLNTPAIYGYGGDGDLAQIQTQTLYWNGVETGVPGTATAASQLPGGIVKDGPGYGTGALTIEAQNIVLGYGPDTTADNQTTLNRTIEGFANVTLAATNSISANNRGSLTVAMTPGATTSTGNLAIETPLLTGAAGSVDSITAQGGLTLTPGTGAASDATSSALGATLNLTGASVSDDTAIVLDTGKLTMTATSGDLDLDAGARVDLAGAATKLVDQTEYSNGGTVLLSAAAGNISTDPASIIDVSATSASAGSLGVSAPLGTVTLDGAIEGGANSGEASGAFTLDANALPSFDALNALLDAGDVFGTRSFELASGDITVDAAVTAKNIVLTADNGSVTVAATGVLNASGAAPGSIAIDASGDVTLDTGALLNASGTVLQTDSYGAPIDAENRAQVSLSTSAGTLVLDDATINVSSPETTAQGQVILNAPRVLNGTDETGNVQIAASGPIDIIGAENIVLYGSRTYQATDANGTITQSDSGIAGSVSLDELNTDNATFMTDAAGNGTLGTNTAGLIAYSQYQLRPADVIESSSASGGNLTVAGDLDLSSMRYGPNAGTSPGAGVAGLLTLRAANNLTVNGSITDGFAAPEDETVNTPDDKGWVLYANEPLSQAVTLPTELSKPVQLANGTSFSTTSGGSLDFGITIARNTLSANVVLPATVTSSASNTVGAGGFTATGTITLPNGGGTYAAGKIVPAGTLLPKGTVYGAGNVLPFQVTVPNGTIWPAGASLSAFASLQVTLFLKSNATLNLTGGETIPGGSSLVFSNNAQQVSLRDKNSAGVQGYIYATASMLPPGSESWSLNLVSGANLGSANLLSVQPLAALAGQTSTNTTDPAGSIVLADTHYTLASKYQPTASFSVIRTGTGSLNLVAGGNIDEQSLFGIYTAGTQTTLGATEDAAFNAGRATSGSTVLGSGYASYNDVVASQVANYPGGGGDVLVSAGNDVAGYILSSVSNTVTTAGSDSIGNWLWRQGGSGLDQSTSWWINFGSYVLPLDIGGNPSSTTPVLAGSTGIGALGGGNVTVVAGNNAGEITDENSQGVAISQGLVVAVASTGRVTAVTGSTGAITGGTEELTGGGSLTVDIGGVLNPALQTGNSYADGGGTLIDMRGDTTVDAQAVGRIDLTYGATNPTDPRSTSPFTAEYASSSNGIVVAPGDGTVTIDTLGDLVLAGAGDPTLEFEQALTAIDPSLLPKHGSGFGGDTGFSLWTDATAIDLFSAGGNLTPTTSATTSNEASLLNDSTAGLTFVYPSTLEAIAASGNLYYGQNGTGTNSSVGYSLELAPSPTGQLALIAAGSIYGNGYAIDMSGAAVGLNQISNPFNPAYTDFAGSLTKTGSIENITDQLGVVPGPDAYFTFEEDTTTTDLHAGDTTPALIYAATGDLVDVDFGEIYNFPLADGLTDSTWYLAAKAAKIYAGQDIVSAGIMPSFYPGSSYNPATFTDTPNQRQDSAADQVASGNLLMNVGGTDISSVTAGRDILSSYYYIVGPGALEVTAGRNLNETGASAGKGALEYGDIKSLGAIVGASAANRSDGAGIVLTVGAGASGPDYTAFANLYFNNANQADLSLPITAPENQGKVQETYEDQLYAWVKTFYGYTGAESGALAFFLTLPTSAQAIFVNDVFYSELNASGAEYSDPNSLFYHSYIRGKQAIATLFPVSGTYDGSITMDSGTLPAVGSSVTYDAGIATLYGGPVDILTPGGAETLGTAGGPAPGASSGVLTEGDGNINIYSLGSVLLGQSRIFTTFGGNILIWSADGDINAGRGAKTTTLLPPPVISYDSFGDITLSPAAPTSGAGIATLAPLAGITPGDVSLIAPEGTVDAGEAGIRVSGNLNIAAQTVVNAANVQVGGKTSGNTASVTTDAAAASAASSAAGASATAAEKAATPASAEQVAETPSIITVEVLGPASGGDDEQRRKRPAV